MEKQKIVIIGGGASALYCASQLDGTKFDIDLYDQKGSLGRKFLVAGYGGFNLSFEENVEAMVDRYTPSSFMEPYIKAHNKDSLVKWLKMLNIPTFVGTSNRIFPRKGIKPVEVLNALLDKTKQRGVKIHTNHQFIGFSDDGIKFLSNKGEINISADIYIWALGGASWSKTGSDGHWLPLFEKEGIKMKPFQASNCTYQVDWPKSFIDTNESRPLKNISLSCGDKSKSGEVVITKFGLEGNAIYPLSPEIRSQIEKEGRAMLKLDLKPMWTVETLLDKLDNMDSSIKRTQAIVKTLNLSKVQIAIVKYFIGRDCFQDNKELAKSIKSIDIELLNAGPIEEAISTVGGIDLSEVDINLMLNKKPNHYVIGEMMDWDAPTGGYLLQACWSMASSVANTLNKE